MLAAALDHHRDVPALRRPDAERDAAVRDLGSDRIAPRASCFVAVAPPARRRPRSRDANLARGVGFRTGAVREPWNHRSPCGIRELSSRRASRLHHRNEEPMPAKTWWQHGIVYQIYPRSFQDSNGDGIGDLKGICERLDYLVWLGVDAIWISPIYPSPMADFGYDVADYCDIDPLFGTLADFDRLVAEAHRKRAEGDPRLRPQPHLRPASVVRGEPLVAHRARSATGTSGAIRKPDGGPPNNWLSNFGGPAWTFDEATGQYYYHAFLSRAARPQLAQPGSAGGDARRAALLARPRRRRLPRRRHLAPDQGRGVPRQPAEPGLPARPSRRSSACCRSTRPISRRCTTSSPRCARVLDEYRRPGADRRDLSAGRAARRLLRRRSLRRPSAVQLPAHPDRLERARDRHAGRASTRRRCRRAAGRTGCSATTTSRASRPRRRRAGARRGDAAAHAARHADDVLRRRDRAARRRDPARAGAGPLGEERARARPRPRSRAHADAVGRLAEARGSRRASPGCPSTPSTRPATSKILPETRARS